MGDLRHNHHSESPQSALPPMLRLTLSNRFEYLLDCLLERLVDERPGPFETQQVIIPSLALRRRIELALADRQGICAQVEFSFLGQWLWTQMGRVIEVQQSSPFNPPALSWRIHSLLGDERLTAAHPRLAHYLGQADPVMRLELAQRTAELLEHYITYRPAWLEAWSAGRRAEIPGLDAARAEDEHWQADLWRRLTAALGTSSEHPAARFFAAVARNASAPARPGLPRSAHVFCLPAVAPSYLDILRQFSQWTQLSYYALNPCEEYWFEVVNPRRLSYLRRQGEAGHHEVGNPLLASWGRQAQAQLGLLLADDQHTVEELSQFFGSGRASLLGQVQDSILALRNPAPGEFGLRADDRSIEIHCCHSLTRELEVLQDQLLACFTQEHPPHPAEILVALPDLAAAAPAIDAVFGTAPASRRIAYVITGRPASATNPVARALLDLMNLCVGRFPASEVFDLLTQVPVARRFGLSAEDPERLLEWIREARIHWGLDESERVRLGMPPQQRHSFEDGLSRLYLAYALGDSAAARRTTVAGRVGAASVEGADAPALGRLQRYVAALSHQREQWTRPRDGAAWHSSLGAAVAQFLDPGTDGVEEMRELQAALDQLRDNMAGGGETRIALSVVREALSGLLDDPVRGGVPSGVLTFCSMSSLRALPYRVICVLGLNDGAFPADQRPAEFDLMALQPRPGDRQRRLDDRNLFLDLLLSARERLYLSYTGRQQRDNSELPPAVVVSELLEFLMEACADPAQPRARAHLRAQLLLEHPLQAFSPQYFLPGPDPRLRSFNEEYAQALLAAAEPAPPALPHPAEATRAQRDDAEEVDPDRPQRLFFPAPLTAPSGAVNAVALERLQRFFRHPSRMLLQERLGLRLERTEEALEDDEHFLPDWKARSDLSQRLLPLLLEGDEEQAYALALADNAFPQGQLGREAVIRELAQMTAFCARLRPLLAAPPLSAAPDSVPVPVAGEQPWRITGVLQGLRPDGLLCWRYDEARAGDYLRAWIDHLFLCAAAPPGVLPRTSWYARGGVFRLRPVEHPGVVLGELVDLYREGLQAPLHFFPRSAWAYAQDHKLSAARSKWSPYGKNTWPEKDDLYHALALRGVDDALGESFERCAHAVFSPLLEHLEPLA